MNSDEKLLANLEAKVAAIEEKVLPAGEKDEKLMKVLNEVDETLTAFSTKRERFNQIFKKVPMLLEYLSPGFIDTISMNNSCEKETVLAAEKDLIAMARQLEEVKKLSEFLDSQKILEVSTYQTRLCKLEMIQHQQLKEVSRASEDLNLLLTSYNELVSKLSNSFAKWDMLLNELENKEEEDS